ncbi:MAG TPA: amidase family protein, partial [Trueperaceae bacterium]|nr:amidase family protein [Trueperaceae bacterium]
MSASHLSAVHVAASVAAGADAAAAVERSLASAEAEQSRLNAFITILRERARAAVAREQVTPAGALAGVPVVVKDNICVAGAPTTAASKILGSFVPPYSATVVERLEAAGAVVVAKANLDEFGMGSTNENSAYGPVLNPLATDRVAGGSSGGSAAAVAAGVVPLALGTDTGGSVRLPAAFCGVVGFKPTYGALSRYGVIAYASSLDQVGVIARSVEDVRLAFDVMRGQDPRDATSFGGGAAGDASGLGSGVGSSRADNG